MTTEIRIDEKIPSHAFRYVERELYDYPAHKTAVKNYMREREAIIGAGRQWPPPEGGRDPGTISDATADIALRLDLLEVRTERARRNVTVVEGVFDALTDEQQRLVEHKYWGRNDYTNDRVASELGISRDVFYQLRREIVRKFALGFSLL